MKSTIKFIPGNRAGITVNPKKAGIIEIRKGLKGINLGDQKYPYAMAYIRVLDEHHYLKGMCIYSDKLPDGYDVIKYCWDPKNALKALKDDRDDPNMPQKLNKSIMTKIKLDISAWNAWEEEIRKITKTICNKDVREKLIKEELKNEQKI